MVFGSGSFFAFWKREALPSIHMLKEAIGFIAGDLLFLFFGAFTLLQKFF